MSLGRRRRPATQVTYIPGHQAANRIRTIKGQATTRPELFDKEGKAARDNDFEGEWISQVPVARWPDLQDYCSKGV